MTVSAGGGGDDELFLRKIGIRELLSPAQPSQAQLSSAPQQGRTNRAEVKSC